MVGWARFRSYARRMRELRQFATPKSEARTLHHQRTLVPESENSRIGEWLSPFIPLFLSPRTTSVTLGFKSTPFLELISDHPKAVIPSVITTLSTLCPDLQVVTLCNLPRNLMISAAVPRMFPVTNQNTPQELRVNSLLTEEANGVLYELPNLRGLGAVIEKGWPRPPHEATPGTLESVTFFLHSE